MVQARGGAEGRTERDLAVHVQLFRQYMTPSLAPSGLAGARLILPDKVANGPLWLLMEVASQRPLASPLMMLAVPHSMPSCAQRYGRGAR